MEFLIVLGVVVSVLAVVGVASVLLIAFIGGVMFGNMDDLDEDF